ncbi:MAG: extracellular solute-binding protein [Firmicutes bacterium]|nr:extracellular solute-binding protein [Bacillota bacterium]
MRKTALLLAIILLLSVIGSAVEITAWITYGGVMGAILQDLIENDFTPATGIEVNYQPYMVDGAFFQKALLALATGDAPDVMTLGAAQVIDMAIRGAITDISQFSDYDDAIKDIYPGAMRALTFKDHVYGIPFELGWTQAFYRIDIFNDLGISPPDTWDEFRAIIPKIQAQGKDPWLSTIGNNTDGHVRSFFPFIYQRGSDIFTADGLSSNLDSPEALDAFLNFTSFYTEQRLPLELPEVQAFMSGDTPYMVTLNWIYAQITRTQPQLQGKWTVTQAPGTIDKDGNLDRTVPLGSFAFAMPNNNNEEKVKASWEFVKWIASDRVQKEFQTRIYDSPEEWYLVFGTRGTANSEIFPENVRTVIDGALSESLGPMPVVGGYQTYRYLSFAFSKVVMQDADPKTVLLEAARDSNLELTRKQKEFERFVSRL